MSCLSGTYNVFLSLKRLLSGEHIVWYKDYQEHYRLKSVRHAL